MKNFQINLPQSNQVFILVDGELVAMDFVSATIVGQSVSYEFASKAYDNSVTKTSLDGVYDDEQAFRDNIPCSKKGRLLVDVLHDCKLSFDMDDETGEITCYQWKMVDGEPKSFPLDVDTFVLKGSVNKDFEANIPDGVFLTRNNLLNWSEYVVVDKDGNKKTVVGKCKKLALTDAQKEAVQKFEDAFKALEDADVLAMYDSGYCNMYFVNGENVSDVDYGEYSDDCDTCSANILHEKGVAKKILNIGAYFNSDDVYSIIFKNNN